MRNAHDFTYEVYLTIIIAEINCEIREYSLDFDINSNEHYTFSFVNGVFR